MTATLAEIIANKKLEIEKRKKEISPETISSQVNPADGRFRKALETPGLHFICEIKPRSPSAGIMRSELQLDQIIRSYGKYATAISVLTDEKYFGGSLQLLRQIREMSSLPLLCKDFIIDPYQCFEARLSGADAVLLIAKILDEDQLRNLYNQIIDLGMVPAVEIQNESELEMAIKLNADVVLINNRNLDTFEIDLRTTQRLAPMLPGKSIKVAASGIETRGDIDLLHSYCTRFLIGSTLMKAGNIDAKLRELKGEVRTGSGVRPASGGKQ